MKNSSQFLKSFNKLSDFYDFLNSKISPQITTILFDLDGTLVHSEPLHAQAGLDTLRKLGGNLEFLPTVEESIEKFRGKSDFIVLEELKKMGVLAKEVSADEFVTLKNHTLLGTLKNTPRQKVMPDDYFHFLHELKKKYSVAIVTASERAVLDGCLEYWKLDSIFSFTLSRDEVERSKPHPEPYLKAFQNFSIKATEALIIEDSQTGQEAAFKSGAFWIEANWYL